jgi:RNA polymerase sigma-70 factor (ECF subfamily)
LRKQRCECKLHRYGYRWKAFPETTQLAVQCSNPAEECNHKLNHALDDGGSIAECVVFFQYSGLRSPRLARASMATPVNPDVTRLLKAWGDGDDAALAQLTPLVYDELHRMAQRCMGREQPGHTLQTSALVNEAYLRLVDAQRVSWQNRAHFFAISARMMRRILTDFARSRHYLKRGGDVRHVTLDDALVVSNPLNAHIVEIDEALGRLALLDARKAQVVELRFFGGLSVDETAEVMKISPETVIRDWRFARVWLRRALSGDDANEL